MGKHGRVQFIVVGQPRALPHKFHGPGLFVLFFGQIMDTIDHHSVVPHQRPQRRCHCRMTKGINLPPNVGSHTKQTFNVIMPFTDLIDHGFRGWIGFVVLNPTATDEFQLTVRNKTFERIFDLFVLCIPPSHEKRNFRPNEPLGWIFGQGLSDTG